jgi:hypothetical protein
MDTMEVFDLLVLREGVTFLHRLVRKLAEQRADGLPKRATFGLLRTGGTLSSSTARGPGIPAG